MVVQHADPNYRPILNNGPTYPQNEGPVVWIDENHCNFGVAATDGSHIHFQKVLRMDGYDVRPFRSEFTTEALRDVEILVIGLALHPSNAKFDSWVLPTPSAFARAEIKAVHQWVCEGGALLLLVDHMPFPGAAQELATAFGFVLTNGHVEDPNRWDPVVFRRRGSDSVTSGSDSLLADHQITRGRSEKERVNAVMTFQGAAIEPSDAEPLLVLDPTYVSYLPKVAFEITPETETIPVGGWLQGAAKRVRKGRMVLMGDTTVFFAQIRADGPRGMNAEGAEENHQLLLNIMHWLSGLLDES